MTTVAQLTIEMAANVARLQTDMAKVRGTVDGAMSSVKKSAEVATTALGAIGGALSVGALATMAKNFANLSNDIDRFSQLAGVSTQRFQEIAFATEKVGIGQEKLSDILKDVQDRVGDFLQTGGGPMADFFEKIAPKVGVTSDQFARLGGQEALQLYVSSLEKANLTQPEMIFYLEAMASDSSLLLPLLKDNGAELEKLAGKARELGVVIKDDTLKSSKDFKKNLDELSGTVESVGISIANSLIPQLNGIVKGFKEIWPVIQPYLAGGAVVLGLSVLPNLITAVAVAVTTRLLPALIPLLPYVAAFSALAAGVGATIKILGANKNALQDLATSQERVLSLEKQIISAQNLIDTGQGSAVTTERLKTLKRNLDEAKKAVAEFQKQIKPTQTEGPISTVSALPAKTPALIKSGIGKPSKPLINKEEIQAKKEAEREYEELIRQIVKDVEDLEREGAAVFKATRTPIELMNIELARLDGLLTAGAIDWDTYSRAVDAATSEVKVSVESSVDIVDDLKDAINGFGREAGNAFVEFAKTGKTSVKDLVTSTLAEFAKMQAQKRVFDPLFKAGESLLSGIDFGSIFKFASGGIMSGAGSMPLKTYSNGGIANSPQLAVFGEGRMNEAYVPLPDGRTIPVTMTGGGGESKVVVNVINQPGQTATVKESQGNGGVRQIDVIIQQVEGAIASNISKGRGPVNSAITSQFGLNRAAGALR